MNFLSILIAIAILVWLFSSFKTVKENELAIVSYFDNPRHVVCSGLQFVPCLIATLVKYSTNMQEYEFKGVGVLSKRTEEHFSVKVTGDLSVRFCFPSDNSLLTHTVKALPRDQGSINSLLKEAALDIVEGVAHNYDWEELYHNTRGFNDKIKEAIAALGIEDEDNILVQAGLRRCKIMFTNPSLPPDLEQAIHKPESAELLALADKKGMIKRAEGMAEARKKQAAAEAVAKKKLADAEAYRTEKEYKAILGGADVSKEDGRAIRQMEAFERAAQGDSNMIISMPELSEFASGAAEVIKKVTKPSKP